MQWLKNHNAYCNPLPLHGKLVMSEGLLNGHPSNQNLVRLVCDKENWVKK